MRFSVGDIVQLYNSRDHTYMITRKYKDGIHDMYKISPMNQLDIEFNYIYAWLDANATRIQKVKR